jgi:hypothetical protein
VLQEVRQYTSSTKEVQGKVKVALQQVCTAGSEVQQWASCMSFLLVFVGHVFRSDCMHEDWISFGVRS